MSESEHRGPGNVVRRHPPASRQTLPLQTGETKDGRVMVSDVIRLFRPEPYSVRSANFANSSTFSTKLADLTECVSGRKTLLSDQISIILRIVHNLG